jgi:hypothetical protein
MIPWSQGCWALLL